MLKGWDALPRGVRWVAGVVAAVVVAATVAWVVFVPAADWIATHDVGYVTGSLRTLRLQAARDAARGRLLTLGAGVFAAGALIFTARNFTLSRRMFELTEQGQQRTFELTEQGQVTDRYTRAIEQIGSEKLDVRIGGIYALERIAHDSGRDHPVVMEVLAAFIREHSREQWPFPELGAEAPDHATRPDVQAAIAVIGRRNNRRDRDPINLTGADLTGADLSGVNLSGAGFSGADLTRAILTDADLSGADLMRVILTGADLSDANLTFADLIDADLTRAKLPGAGLSDADLTRAILTDADLTDTKLSNAKLSGAILAGAGLAGAILAGAGLTGAELSSADLTGAQLTNALLNRADLTDAKLTGTNFTDADLTDAMWPERAALPPGWDRHVGSGRVKRVSNNPGADRPVN